MSTFKCNCHYCGKELVRKKQGVEVKYHFCNNVCKGEYQKTFKPVSKEWLIEYYIDKKMDCTQIAHIVNRDPKSVWNWLKDLGIPTRARGENPNWKWIKEGKDNPMKGKHHSKETREKQRQIALADGRKPFKESEGPYCKGKKGAETTNWKGGITPERQAFYSSEEWSEAVKAIWKRDNAYCQRCGKHHNETENRGTFHIHHIVSFMVKELRADVNNLVLLCYDCHKWVHSNKNKEKNFIKEVDYESYQSRDK